MGEKADKAGTAAETGRTDQAGGEGGRAEEFALLDSFYKATGVGALYIDRHLEIRAYAPASHLPHASFFLNLSEAGRFLRGIIAGPEKKEAPEYYTFITENNFFCSIVPLYREGVAEGALFTEPMLAQKPSAEEVREILRHAETVPGDRRELKKLLPQVPVVAYERMMPIGRLLYGLGASFFSPASPRQVLYRGRQGPAARPQKRPAPRGREASAALRYSSYSAFLKIREAIRSGDVAALLQEMKGIDFGSVGMGGDGGDLVRSVKNDFIKACALGCYAALDGNAPYERVMDLGDDYIRQAEALTNVYDIYERIQDMMVAFARTVSISGALYAKPVNQVMEYIERHYAEKITLAQLGAYTGLSTFYLSGLIRKGTGLILTDNINKMRVEKSKALLRDRNISILEAAQRVGFTHQNHFAAVFKKFAGVTPTEYRKSLGVAAAENGRRPDGMLPIVYGQALNMVKMFPGLYDAARVVDPVRHQSWMVNDREELSHSDTCYRFWHRGESCENCISRSAYLLGITTFKIENSGGTPYLVLATPKTVGKETFVVELFKELGGKQPLPGEEPEGERALLRLADRVQVEERLGMEIRRCRMEGVPLSVAVLQAPAPESADAGPEPPASETWTPGAEAPGAYMPLLESLAELLRGLPGGSVRWAAHYTGRYFLLALCGADAGDAQAVARRAADAAEKWAAARDAGGLPAEAAPAEGAPEPKSAVRWGVGTLADGIADADALIRQALEALRAFAAPAAVPEVL